MDGNTTFEWFLFPLNSRLPRAKKCRHRIERWDAAGLRSSAYPCARIAGLAQQPAEHAWAKTVFGLYLIVKNEAGVISSAGNDAVIGMVVGARHRREHFQRLEATNVRESVRRPWGEGESGTI